VTTYAQKPDDPSAAIAAHQTLTLFSRPAEAQEVENALATQFRDDPHVQWYLAEYYRQQGQSELSEECIKHLLTLTDYDPGTVSQVAMAKILWHDLEDAKQLLERIDPSSLAVSSDAYLLLGRAYQNRGEHASALECYRTVRAVRPSIVEYPWFRGLVRRSERRLGIYPSTVPEKRFYLRWGLLATAAAVLLLVTMTYLSINQAQHRTLYVVNGLPVPIEVVIDGQKNQIRPNAHLPLAMAEGHHQGELLTPVELAEHFQFQMHTPWWQRFTHTPAFILDPARATMLCKRIETATAQHEGPMDIVSKDFFIGQLYTHFEHIDKAFPEPGFTFTTSTTVAIRKNVLIAVDVAFLYHVLASDENNLTTDQTLDILERHLLTTQNNEQLLTYYAELCQSHNELGRYKKNLKRRLTERPVNLSFHGAYQNMMNGTVESQVVLQYYRDLL
ncbi:MAG: tetratricopeptide repeat protein, partial [Planctomycetota bacterium]